LSSNDFWYIYGSIPTNTGGYQLVRGTAPGGGGLFSPGGGVPSDLTNGTTIYSNLSTNPAAVDLSKLILGYTVDKQNAENLLGILNIFVDRCLKRSDITNTHFARLYACSTSELLDFLEGNAAYSTETNLKQVILARAVQIVTGSSYDAFRFLENNPNTTAQIWNFVINKNNSSPDAVGYSRMALKQLVADGSYKWRRFEELYDLVQADKQVLLADCNVNYSEWDDLINFEVVGWAEHRINSNDHWELLDIEDARSPTVNLDRFSVFIEKMPIINGERMTEQDFFNYFRLNINDFTGGTTFTPSDYSGDDINDSELWNSIYPFGSILHIDMLQVGNMTTVDGDVLCSQYNCCSWIFSTLRTGTELFDSGWHPVSGNRQFGFTTQSEQTELYTRAADRITVWWVNLIGPKKTFDDGAAVWRTMQNQVIDFVERNGGRMSSQKKSEEVNTPDWEAIRDRLKGTSPIFYIPCDK
jgi:hypothetical protein